MSNDTLPARDSVDAQREMFRRAEQECGLTIAVIAKRSPLSVSTMKGWREGAAMPAWAIGALGNAGVPDHILSLVLEPFARHVGTNGEDEDLDGLADDARDYVHEHDKARSPHSPGGVVIIPQERAKLIPLAGRVKSRARRAA
jgi:hypothetical protein